MCLLFIFAFLLLFIVFGAFGESTELGILCLSIYLFVFIALFKYASNKKQEEEEEEEEKAENERKYIARQKAAAENRLNARIREVVQKYGSPDKLIKIGEYRYIAAFAKYQILCISDTEIAFNEILSAKIIDNYEIEHGEINGTDITTTSTSSLLGRSAAGAIIGGGTGAIIGALSASKYTTVNYTQANDKVIHDYVLIINLNRFNSSTIKVRIGNDWKMASEVEHIIDLINIYNQQIAR